MSYSYLQHIERFHGVGRESQQQQQQHLEIFAHLVMHSYSEDFKSILVF